MTPEQIELFAELIEHNKNNRHHEWDFRAFKHISWIDSEYKPCGCAAGELPYLFPERWAFTHSGEEVYLIGHSDPYIMPDSQLARFFGIDMTECEALFFPGCKDDDDTHRLYRVIPIERWIARAEWFLTQKRNHYQTYSGDTGTIEPIQFYIEEQLYIRNHPDYRDLVINYLSDHESSTN